jgi:hypothetical protein
VILDSSVLSIYILCQMQCVEGGGSGKAVEHGCSGIALQCFRLVQVNTCNENMGFIIFTGKI